MPVYEYKCASCGTTYDVLHKGREIIEDIVCPSCDSPDHKKLMSAPSVSSKASVAGESPCGTGDCCGGACGLN